MQHFRFVNWRIEEFFYWCYEQVTLFLWIDIDPIFHNSSLLGPWPFRRCGPHWTKVLMSRPLLGSPTCLQKTSRKKFMACHCNCNNTRTVILNRGLSRGIYSSYLFDSFKVFWVIIIFLDDCKFFSDCRNFLMMALKHWILSCIKEPQQDARCKPMDTPCVKKRLEDAHVSYPTG